MVILCTNVAQEFRGFCLLLSNFLVVTLKGSGDSLKSSASKNSASERLIRRCSLRKKPVRIKAKDLALELFMCSRYRFKMRLSR